MSSLIYNNIELSLIKTNSIDRQTRMSDDRTEYMWTTFTIDITCIYNPGATSYPTPGILPMETDDLTRSLLMQPRQPLFFSEGGIPILDIPSNLASGGAIDCENGPIPIACNITRIASARLFFVRYVIKASIIECPSGTIVSAVASSRYSRTESLDGQYRATMTTAGKAMFRSNVLVAINENADAFRGYIIPDPLLGYKRMLIKVGIDSSGIEMEWMTVDVEQFVDLGDGTLPNTAGSFGITEMDLEYSTSTLRDGSVGISGILGVSATVEASAKGARTANRLTMLMFLARCSVNKLGVIVGTGLPTQMSMRENIFNNSISMVLTYQVLPTTGSTLTNMVLGLKGFVGAPIASLPPTGGVNIQPPYSNATRGMLAYQLAVNAFATACYSNINSIGGCDVSGAVPPDVGNYNGQCIGSPQVFAYGLLDDPSAVDLRRGSKQSARGPNPAQTAYRMFSIESKFVTVSGTIPAQIASNPGVSTSQSSRTQVALQLFQPYTNIAVHFAIERYGCDPEIPDSVPSVAGYSLLKQTLSPIQIEVGPDGSTPIFRLTGMYAYMNTSPTLNNPVIPFPIPPWLSISPSQFTETAKADYININGAWNTQIV